MRTTGPRLVSNPALVEDSESRVEHRISVTRHEQLDLEREAGVYADLVARLRQAELLCNGRGEGVLVAEPHPESVVLESGCRLHQGHDAAAERPVFAGPHGNELRAVVGLQRFRDRKAVRSVAHGGNESLALRVFLVEEKCLLLGEVREDGGWGDVRLVGDLAHAHSIEAALEEQLLRRFQNQGPGHGLLPLPPSGLVRIRSHAWHRTSSSHDWIDTKAVLDTLS